ncbi:MAG: AraC family transcriptional regulator [Roseburia sp.]|nr:AraC family transcriptional regulator [Roseburia sp.]MCM1279015.1 AraC family transcriptional regulator [Robinsoniella sp.]
MHTPNYHSYKEKRKHGNIQFPFTIYKCMIPDFFTSYPIHWHPEMEIIYVEEGMCQVTLNLETYQLEKGDILFITPGLLHSIEGNGLISSVYYNIIFDFSLLLCKETDICNTKYLLPYIEGTALLPPILKPPMKHYSQIQHYLEALILDRKIREPGFELLTKSRLMLLFYYLEPLKLLASQEYATENSSKIQQIKQILFYVENNYSNPITIKEAASLCNFSPSYFMKFFKSATGTSFLQYVKHYRLEMAASLLVSTDLSVLSISEEVGFRNHSYFIRAFKEKFGRTPREYRK